MNIRDLKYLVAVQKQGHFGHAAKACFVSQPTLSMQLKKLEEELGVKLIERNNKQVLMTPIGISIAAKAEHILQEVEAIKNLAKQEDPLQGTLKIGIIPTLAPYLLPYLIPWLSEFFPGVSPYLKEAQTSQIHADLRQGDLDAMLLALPINDDSLTGVTLFAEDFCLATPKGHPLIKKTRLSPKDLQPYSLLLLTEGHCLRDQALMLCQSAHLSEKLDFSATSLETLRQMVAAGVGITLLPKLAVKAPVINEAAIATRPFTHEIPQRQIGLLWRKGSPRDALLKVLSERLKQAIPKILPLG